MMQTNNPRKIEKLEELGIPVVGRIPCLVKPGEFSQGYLIAKGKRMQHMDLASSWDSSDQSQDGTDETVPPILPVDEQTF